MVSIITAVYNGEKYIAQTIESVLQQTYDNWEMIIIDDGSTDKSKMIIEEYLGDNRIRYVYQDNMGALSSRNSGLAFAAGEYVAVLDQDDIWIPNKLKKQIEILKNNPAIGIVYSGIQRIDESGNKLDTAIVKDICDDPFMHLLFKNYITFSSVLIRRSALNEHLIDKRFNQIGDAYLYLSLAVKEYNFGFVEEPMVLYRIHQNSLSRSINNLKEAHSEQLTMLKEFEEVVPKSKIMPALALSHLGLAVSLIKYDSANDDTQIWYYINKALQTSKSLPILLRTFKWSIIVILKRIICKTGLPLV
jgi:glycosyltransferase involved in cell wall biosynthesis